MGSPQYIQPPPAPPVPPGLFDVALGPMPFPEPATVANGLIWLPDTCGTDVQLISMECPTVTGSVTFAGIDASVSGAPFAVAATYQCSPVGIDLVEAKRRVEQRLTLREQRAVETRVWSGSTGGLGTIPSLFAGATVVGPAACPVEAMELLEQWIADNGILGAIIHARPAMAPHLFDHHQLREVSGRRFLTPVGTQVVFGQGYAGTGPTGQAVTADTEWMFASGRVLVWRDDVFTPPLGQTFDRTNNVVYAMSQRVYAVGIECGVAAVEVTRTCST